MRQTPIRSYPQFARALRSHRLAQRYKQSELAQELALAKVTISKWEQGTHLPGLPMLTLLSALLKTDLLTPAVQDILVQQGQSQSALPSAWGHLHSGTETDEPLVAPPAVQKSSPALLDILQNPSSAPWYRPKSSPPAAAQEEKHSIPQAEWESQQLARILLALHTRPELLPMVSTFVEDMCHLSSSKET